MSPRLAAALLWVGAAHAHQGNLRQEPWQACAELPLDAACSFENIDGDVFRGTCRGEAAPYLCVRSQPILRHAEAHSHGDPHVEPHGDPHGDPEKVEHAHGHAAAAAVGGVGGVGGVPWPASVGAVLGVVGALVLGAWMGRRG